MQVILDSLFARPGSAPKWGGKKGEFRDWTINYYAASITYVVTNTTTLSGTAHTSVPL